MSEWSGATPAPDQQRVGVADSRDAAGSAGDIPAAGSPEARVQVKARKLHAGSLNSQLATIEVGGYLYLEVAGDGDQVQQNVQRLQASVLGSTRYPASMRGWRFKVAAYTAVRATLGDVRILVRVERLQ